MARRPPLIAGGGSPRLPSAHPDGDALAWPSREGRIQIEVELADLRAPGDPVGKRIGELALYGQARSQAGCHRVTCTTALTASPRGGTIVPSSG